MNRKISAIMQLIMMILFSIGGLMAQESQREYDLSDELKISEIEENTYLVTHSFPWPGNSLILVMDESTILWIDTPYTPEATAQVLDWIQKELGSGYSITEINTGFHIDNLGGNRELSKRNIPIIGSDLTCELLDSRSGATMSKMTEWLRAPRFEKYRDVYSSFSFTKPTDIFPVDEEQHLKSGTEDVVIYYPGPTHTYDNLVVFIPGKELLFGGCMILSSDAEKVGYAEDGNLDEWSRSLRILDEHFENIRIVVPGHGDPGDRALIAHTREITDEH